MSGASDMPRSCHSTFFHTFAAVILCVAGCDAGGRHSPRDMAELAEVIHLTIPAKSAQWEVFGTPEYQGAVPGPTDFTTLVAELQGIDESALTLDAGPASSTFVVPEAARPWLSPAFRKFLDDRKNTQADIGAAPHCKRHQTTTKKSALSVEGFVCAQAGRALLYLTMSSP